MKKRRPPRQKRPPHPTPSEATPTPSEPSSPSAGPSGQFLRPGDLAERLGVSVRTIANWRERGALPLYRIGPGRGHWGLTEGEFAEWLRSNRPEGGTDGQPCS